MDNPWNVTSLEEFHFYNCPECDEKYGIKEQFVGHAMIMHPKACEFIPGILHKQKIAAEQELVIANVQSVPILDEEHDDNGAP